MRKSKEIRKHYEAEIERATTINELVWIGGDYKQDMSLTCDDLLSLCRMSDKKKYNLKAQGQKYTIARKPAWR